MTPEILSSLKWSLLELVPSDGEAIGNITLKPRICDLATSRYCLALTDRDYEDLKSALVADGVLIKGGGRGGSVRRDTSGSVSDNERACIEIAGSLILELLPPDGTSRSNMSMMADVARLGQERFAVAITKDHYQSARAILKDAGLLEQGAGYTGTVRRSNAQPVDLSPNQVEETADSSDNEATKVDLPRGAPPRANKIERELYAPLRDTIIKHWVKRHGIDDHICEVTASQGSKDTGGKWTRPDLTLVAVRTYEFVHGKTVEVITFEVKPLDAYGVDGVFETASHTVAANLSFLLLHVQDELEPLTRARLEKLAVKFGVGLVIFRDPSNWDTFSVIVEAVHHVPEPSELSGFIGAQLNQENRSRISRLLK